MPNTYPPPRTKVSYFQKDRHLLWENHFATEGEQQQLNLNTGKTAGLTQTKHRQQAGMNEWKASASNKDNQKKNRRRKVGGISALGLNEGMRSRCAGRRRRARWKTKEGNFLRATGWQVRNDRKVCLQGSCNIHIPFVSVSQRMAEINK